MIFGNKDLENKEQGLFSINDLVIYFPLSTDKLRAKAGRTMVDGAVAGHSKFLLKHRGVSERSWAK
ncbi:hypothetical protein G7092_30255 [Mucilaginibacter sp. HC2]|uniref:hypothetical protein n=1 Tax=Mucilaginibacter inviolabilis TaxID=2714892 RepID=UPI00140929F0|nr:hypothetical protein [Mucilaginibacter inviolabilis]NHA08123.1 hypothetical protein [Mucilaginibacter inviolabilis]